MKILKYVLILGFLAVLTPPILEAGFPPTTSKGQSDSSATTTFNFQTPNYQMSKVNSTTALIETGNKNRLKDPSCESSSCTSNWASPSVAPTRTTTSGQFYEGAAAISWDSTGAAQYLTSSTVGVNGGGGKNAVVSCLFKCASGTCTHTLTANDGTNDLATATTITSDANYFARTSVNFIEPTSGTYKVKIASVASNEPALYVDDCYLGPAEGFNVFNTNSVTNWTAWTPTSSWTGTITYTGFYRRVGDTLEAHFKMYFGGAPSGSSLTVNLPTGLVIDTGKITASAQTVVGEANLDESSGNSNIGSRINYNSTTSVIVSYIRLSGSLYDYPGITPTTPVSLGNTDAVSGTFRVPIVGWGAESSFSAGQIKYPTVQTFTSGTNQTYTRPNNVTFIKVKMVGGGGGGGGGGTTSGTAATAGGTTFFGPNPSPGLSPYLQANGGNLGTRTNGPTGGSATINSPAFGTALTGGSGGSATGYSGASNTTVLPGATGGSSCFAGGGAGGSYLNTGAGAVGPTNTGAGGGGGGTDLATNAVAGSGGGAGGCIEAWIQTPPASLYYTVGAAGSGQAAGTSGSAGGNGAAGYIEVTEYYGAFSPILVGGVTAPDYAGATRINTIVSKSGNYTATDAEETIVFTADATLTLPAAAGFKGKKYHVVVSGSGTDITIDPNGSETVCGQTTIQVNGTNDEATIQSDGTNWVGLNGACERTTRIKITNSGTPTITSQQGNWVSSLTDGGTGITTLVIPSGLFSATPTCSALITNSGGSSSRYCNIQSMSTTAITTYCYSAGSPSDENHDLLCKGAR